MRLIDADELGKTDRPVGKLMMFGGEYVYTQTEIDRAPTIDAVPVVRCGECERWQKPFDAYPRGWCKKLFRWKDREGYCDEAQRREDGDA